MIKKLEPSFHSKLNASSAERWVNCPGSVREAAKYPNVAMFEAAEGTFAHHIAAHCLGPEGVSPDNWLGNKTIVEGHVIECDQEMVDGVQEYLDDIMADRQPGDLTWAELSLHEALQKLDPEFGGTADFVRWRPATAHLRVQDLKYGAGVLVEPEDNRQLRVYALGVLLATGLPATKVEVRVTQPRIPHAAGPHRSWEFDGIELVAFARELQEAAVRTRNPQAPLVPGPWCKKTFCPAAAHCPAVNAQALALVGQDDFAVDRPYDKDTLLKGLAMIGPLKAKIKAMEELAYHEANAGRLTPEDGWKLVEKRKTRKWNDEIAVAALVDSVNVNPWEAPALLSPAQMEKALKARKDVKEAIQEFITAESSGTALVPVSDARPEVKRLDDKRDFAAIDDGAVKPALTVVNLFN